MIETSSHSFLGDLATAYNNYENNSSNGMNSGGPDNSGEHVFYAVMNPANNSGATGAALFTLDDNSHTLRVDLVADGLTPGEQHPAHVHSQEDGTPSQLPTIAFDADRDGFVEDPEAEQ